MTVVVVVVVMPRSRRLIRLRRQAWWWHPLQRIRRYTLSDESKAGIFVHGAVVVWTLAIGAQADPVVATITIGLGHIGVLVHGSRPVEICVHHASYGRRAVDRLCKRRILTNAECRGNASSYPLQPGKCGEGWLGLPGCPMPTSNACQALVWNGLG